ncbi:serine/threonine protein kinase [Citricoccus sp. SGAir0253]|uniref:serine/threonine-protein kinase n=1 Tax=Citricoccus sp. SGAir0253 TaxID=2567881 RepID=UPI0010CCD080|nr:serine/threonine-protein kinase [Citricoccus sp. SGAir0253]QCU77859.1 serine/threonine protein kinase [Citricoccus sp. SGAir0253]
MTGTAGRAGGRGVGTMDASDDVPEVPGWHVVRELGRGGGSAVWLVADDGGRRAALKVPDRRVVDPAGLLEAEVRAVGELVHDHVVRPLGVVETDRGPGLLSEYHAGGSLGALVRAAGPLPVGQVVTVLVPLAQALQVLHERGVVHGDVSPGNVLFTVEGRPALADLGSSRLLGGPAARTGTAGFTAPELEAPRGGPSGAVPADGPDGRDREDGANAGLCPAADVYSLAAVGWYALAGRAPARTASRAPLPLIVPDIPAEAVALLEAALDEDPVRRPRADRFAQACYRWARAEPVDLHPSASAEVARELPTRRRAGPARPPRRRPVVLAAGAAALLALVGGGAVLAGGGPRPGPAAPAPVAASAPAPAAPRGPVGAAEPSPGAGTGVSAPAPGAPARSVAGGAPGRTEATGAAAGLRAADPRVAAVALGRARTRALASLDRRAVDDYTLPGSPARRADLDLVDDLRGRGLRYRGLSLETSVVGPVERSGARRARVPLELAIGPYRTVTAAGEPVAETRRTSAERFTAGMVRTAEGWRVERILPSAGPAADPSSEPAPAPDAEGRPAGGPAGRPSGTAGVGSGHGGQE